MALVWGAIDGWRRPTFRALAIRWAVVGVVTGGFASAYIQAGPEPLDLDVLFSDLIAVGLFEAALVTGAAVTGGALTRAAGGAYTRTSSTEPRCRH